MLEGQTFNRYAYVKSIFYGDNKTAQGLLDEFAGKGEFYPNGTKKELILIIQ